MSERDYAIGLFCLSPSRGGLEMHVADLAGWLADEGWTVYLFASPGSLIAERAKSDNKVRLIEFKSSFRYGDIPGALRLAKLIKKFDIRFLSVHRTPDLFLAVLAKKMAKSRFKLAFSQHLHIGSKLDFFHRWEYRHIDLWITPIRFLAEQTRQNTILEDNRIHIIAQGMKQQRFLNNRYDKAAARAELDLPDKALIAGLIGRFDPLKGQHTLIEALSVIHRKGHKLHLLLAGETTRGEHRDFKDKLNDMIRKFELEQYVHFRPFRNDPEIFYAALDIFVMASSFETYGLVTIEAMLSGLPVVGSASGGTAEIISDRKTGLLFQPKDHKSLAEAITTYVEDKQLRQNLAGQARQDASARFSHRKQSRRWSELIEQSVR